MNFRRELIIFKLDFFSFRNFIDPTTDFLHCVLIKISRDEFVDLLYNSFRYQLVIDLKIPLVLQCIDWHVYSKQISIRP